MGTASVLRDRVGITRQQVGALRGGGTGDVRAPGDQRSGIAEQVRAVPGDFGQRIRPRPHRDCGQVENYQASVTAPGYA